MERQPARNDSHDPLLRVVTLLLALATLAEQASSAAPAVCRLVLWILRPAEAAAQRYLSELTMSPIPAAPDFLTAPAGDDSREAICLALRLRALAAAIEYIALYGLYFWSIDQLFQAGPHGRPDMRELAYIAAARRLPAFVTNRRLRWDSS